MDLLERLLLSFVPLFVAMDAIGTLAIITPLTSSMTERERSRVAHVAMLTAGGIGLLFLVLGSVILRSLGITVGHFAIAGGLILLALSMKDVLAGKQEVAPTREEMVAVVPIGTPLISGPAVLTTLLLLSDQYGFPVTLVALLVNLLLAWLILWQGNRIVRFLGPSGTQAASKIANLFLAAIAVRMIFTGLQLTLGITVK